MYTQTIAAVTDSNKIYVFNYACKYASM